MNNQGEIRIESKGAGPTQVIEIPKTLRLFRAWRPYSFLDIIRVRLKFCAATALLYEYLQSDHK